MSLCMQALFADDTDTKLSAQITKRKLILQAVGDDPPSQMAQLLALEYLVGVTDPDRLNQVCSLFNSVMPRCYNIPGIVVLHLWHYGLWLQPASRSDIFAFGT